MIIMWLNHILQYNQKKQEFLNRSLIGIIFSLTNLKHYLIKKAMNFANKYLLIANYLFA